MRKLSFLFALFLIFGLSNATFYTSAGSGNWNTTTTWTPNGVPTLGDGVRINAAHRVTIPSGLNVSIGNYSQWSIDLLGNLILAPESKLQINGDMQENAGSANLTMYSCSILLLNGSIIRNLGQQTTFWSIGNSSCYNQINSTVQGRYNITGQSALYADRTMLNYTRMFDLGNSLFRNPAGAGTGYFYADHLQAINYTDFQINIVATDTPMVITNSDFRPEPSKTTCINMAAGRSSLSSTTIPNLFINNTIVQILNGVGHTAVLHSPQITFNRNVLINCQYLNFKDVKSADSNLVIYNSTGNADYVWQVSGGYNLTNSYMYADGANAHPFQGGGGGVLWNISRNIFEAKAGDSNWLTPATLTNTTLWRNIKIGNGILYTSTVVQTGATLLLGRNTVYGIGEGGASLMHVETVSTYNAKNASSWSNLVSYPILQGDVSTPVYVLKSSGASNATINYSDYEGIDNVSYTINYQVQGITMGNAGFGANNKVGAANFVDASRNLTRYGNLFLGTKGIQNASLVFAQMNGWGGTANSSVTIESLMAYVRAGFTPQNSLFDNAGLGGEDIGAEDFSSSPAQPPFMPNFTITIDYPSNTSSFIYGYNLTIQSIIRGNATGYVANYSLNSGATNVSLGSIANNTFFNVSLGVMGGGNITFAIYASNGTNQSQTENQYSITPYTQFCNLTLNTTSGINGNLTIILGNSTTVQGSSSNGTSGTLYRDGSGTTNPETFAPANATYNYTYVASGNANYTSCNQTYFLFGNAGPPPAFNPIFTVRIFTPLNNSVTTYGASFNVNFQVFGNATAYNATYQVDGGSNLSEGIVLNGSNYSISLGILGGGAHSISIWAVNGTFLNGSTHLFNVSAYPQFVNLSLNGVESNLTLLEQTQSTALASSSNLSGILYRNGAIVSNPDVQTLANGTYNYTFTSTGNENYTTQSKTFFLTIQYIAPQITIVSPLNLTYSQSSASVNLTVSANKTMSSWWYRLNSSGSNVSFTFPTTFITAGNGSNFLQVWANDSQGATVQALVYFTLNISAPLPGPTPGAGGAVMFNTQYIPQSDYMGLAVGGIALVLSAYAILRTRRNEPENSDIQKFMDQKDSPNETDV